MLRQNRQLTRARINITVTPPRYAKPRHATPHWTERCRGGEWVETKEWNVTRLTHFRPFCCLVNLLYMFHHVAIILFCISAFRCIMYCTAQIGITIWTVSCTTLYSFLLTSIQFKIDLNISGTRARYELIVLLLLLLLLFIVQPDIGFCCFHRHSLH